MSSLPSIIRRLAEELSARENQVTAAVGLLDEGATVPFIARYRKEATGGLDDIQLRLLEERLAYLRELEDRRAVILKSVEEQGHLTDELKRSLLEADTKTRLEDLYLPYRPKRRTKAQIAREAGLEPLALALLEDPSLDPERAAAGYVDADKGVADTKAALDGARQILMERFAENADLLGSLREYLWERGEVRSRVAEGKHEEGAKFADYFDAAEPIRTLPSHRALALFRGRNEGVLLLELAVAENPDGTHPCEALIAFHAGVSDRGHPADGWLRDTVRWAWKVKISLSLELELMGQLREHAEEEAIKVFARNLHDLLLAAPAGPRPTLALDPGLRTGVKVAVVDTTGKVVATDTVYPHAPRNQWDAAINTLARHCEAHGVELVSIGNGTASRETDRLVLDLMKRHPGLRLQKLVVSEAGASVYSASELASRELPGLDVSLRGAVSIGRRLQDPLAELVKIDPKSIGVGQYQHDVSQVKLARALDAVVEDCVNAVGVDVNTASPALLARVSGLSAGLAENIVAFRNEHGPFPGRAALKRVPRLGEKTFEQAAGFLRIMGGEDPLDSSAVHPEAYPVVRRIQEQTGRDIRAIISDSAFLQQLNPRRFTDERFGLPTVTDILGELEKPGRDPRPEFRTAAFREGVEAMKDLEAGMVLEGVVTNVTNFGAFVDVGVHQDGLVHISNLANRFVKDPHEVVKAGDLVKVKVMEVDLKRKRIGLTMRLDDAPERSRPERSDSPARGRAGKKQDRGGGRREAPQTPAGAMAGAFAEAFAKAGK